MAEEYKSYSMKYGAQVDPYEAQELPTYEAQTDYVNQLYDAKQESDVAALTSANNQNMLDSEANLAKIPKTYQQAANTTEAEAEKNRMAYNEYANARGTNSGTASQAQLAMNIAKQNDLASIRASQAEAIANADLEITKLKTAYQDNIAAAKKDNDYQRAVALLQEYQTQAQSVVDVAQAQADEYYKAWQSAVDEARYEAEWQRKDEQTRYDRQM